MTPLIVNILAFSAVFLTVFAASAFIADLRSSDRKRVRERMKEQHRQQQRQRARSTAPNFSRIAAEARAEGAERRPLKQRLQDLVDQSGVNTTVRRIVILCATLGAVFGLVGFLVSGLIVSSAFGGGAASLPLIYLCMKRKQRLDKLRSQLPDAFGLISRVLRAGQTVPQGMQAVADEFSSPISLEFLYCSEQMNLGLSAEDSLRELAQRTGLLEIKIFVLSVVVHRQTGGNLVELLDNLSHVVRERFRIQGMIQSLTAQGRFQAGILLSLPLAMFVLLMLIHREYEMILLQYPLLIALALSLMGIGALWIRKIVNFDF
jgi:tight adherence protein B